MRNRGRESRQDGVLAQMKTVPGYVFVDGYICGCVTVCVCVCTCACMCVSSVCKRSENDRVCEQHAPSDHSYVGTQAVNLGVVT